MTQITGGHENRVGKEKVVQECVCKREVSVKSKTRVLLCKDINHVEKWAF